MVGKPWRWFTVRDRFYYLARVATVLAEIQMRLRRPRRVAPRALLVPPGAAGSLGDEAMVLVSIEELRRRGFAVHLGVWGSADAEGRQNVEVQDVSWLFSRRTRLRRLWRLLRLFVDYDAVFLLGADILDGGYDNRQSLRRIRLAECFGRQGKPAVMLGFSFNAKPETELVSAMVEASRYARCYARDPLSLSRLKNEGVAVEAAADCAMLFRPGSDLSDEVREVLDWMESECARGRRLLGLNLNANPLLGELLSANLRLSQAELGVRIARLLITEHDISIVCVAHDDRSKNRDHVEHLRLASLLNEKERRHMRLLPATAGPAGAKQIAARCDFVISGRMHFAIAAISSGVPAAVFEYQDKVTGMLELVGLPDHVLDPCGFRSVDEMLAYCLTLLNCSAESAERLSQTMPGIQDLARQQFE